MIESREFAGPARPSPWVGNTAQTSSTSYSYAGVTSTVTDAAGRARTTTVDGLGRTLSATAGGVLTASYEYDVFDNLTKVTQVE